MNVSRRPLEKGEEEILNEGLVDKVRYCSSNRKENEPLLWRKMVFSNVREEGFPRAAPLPGGRPSSFSSVTIPFTRGSIQDLNRVDSKGHSQSSLFRSSNPTMLNLLNHKFIY
jgi:hypothetical protein